MHATLTADQCKLVQASFAQVDPVVDGLASRFYRRLFELNPDLRSLFKVDMALQREQFLEKLAVAVKGLEDLDSIAPFVRTLGRRHASYGVKVQDYDTLGEALLWALEEELGPTFGNDVRQAWSAAYKVICRMMIEAAEA